MGVKGSITVAKVRGIPVRLHYTFLIILPYLAWVIHRSAPTLAQVAGVSPQSLVLPGLALGTLLALALFACVLLHEFAHVVVGMRGGARFSGVTLMIVGGVSEVVELPRRPSREAAMAVAGPVASLILSGLCFGAYLLFTQPDVSFAFFYLSYVNLALAIFNLVPAFPMDGGRIVRALLAMVTNRVRATRVAAAIGQAFALLFLAAGVYTFNWLLLLVGILVVAGARAEVEMVKSNAAIEGLIVEDAMQRFVPTVEINDPLAPTLARMERELKTTLFVVSRGDYVGVIHGGDAQRKAQGSFATVGDAMRSDVPSLHPRESLSSAMQRLRESGSGALPVLGENRLLLGFVSLHTIALALRRLEERAAAARLQEQQAT